MSVNTPGAVGKALVTWLRGAPGRDGRIRDPVHGEYGTYADGFAALAFGLAADRDDDVSLWALCGRSCAIAAARPADSEFDQLALLLLGEVLDRRGSALPGAGEMRPHETALYSGGRLVSNNWVAMRALSRSLRAKQSGRADHRVEAARVWSRVLSWQQPCGLFVDSPAGTATPVAYHAKFCAMLALAVTLAPEECPEDPLRSALQRGLAALEPLVSPWGVLAPFGRSRNTLFGSAAAVTAFLGGASVLDDPELAGPGYRVLNRLAAALSEDRHIPCVLNRGEADKRDWDVYVNNADYNAYAAGMLLLADRLWPVRPTLGRLPDTLTVERVGPLVVARGGRYYAVLAAEGQFAPFGTPFFCDTRYAGLQPLYVERDFQPLFEPAAYQWDRAGVVDPARAGWIPYVENAGERFAVRIYDRVELSQEGDCVRLTGEGRPVACAPLTRMERGLRGLGGSAAPQYRAKRLGRTTLRRTLVLDTQADTLEASTELRPARAGLVQGRTHWRRQ